MEWNLKSTRIYVQSKKIGMYRSKNFKHLRNFIGFKLFQVKNNKEKIKEYIDGFNEKILNDKDDYDYYFEYTCDKIYFSCFKNNEEFKRFLQCCYLEYISKI